MFDVTNRTESAFHAALLRKNLELFWTNFKCFWIGKTKQQTLAARLEYEEAITLIRSLATFPLEEASFFFFLFPSTSPVVVPLFTTKMSLHSPDTSSLSRKISTFPSFSPLLTPTLPLWTDLGCVVGGRRCPVSWKPLSPAKRHPSTPLASIKTTYVQLNYIYL